MRKLHVALGTLLLFVAFSVAQEMVTVKVSVAETISNNNLDKARQAAVTAARQQCVRQVLRNDLLGAEQFRQKSEMLQLVVLVCPDAYLGRFTIDDESLVDDGQRYKVSVTAEVRKAALSAALVERGIVDPMSLSAGPLPQVMVLVRERFETRVTGTSMVESVLIRRLRESGFKVIDPEQGKALEVRNLMFAEAGGNMRAALQLAVSSQVDYLVTGDAAVTSGAPIAGTDMKPRFANLNLKLIDTSSADILAAITRNGKSRHVDELTGGNWALEEAAQGASKDLLAAFAEIRRNRLVEGAEIIIDASGIEFDSQATALRSVLAGIDQVTTAHRRFFASGVARYEVRYKGLSEALANALRREEVENQPIEVLEVLPRYLRIRRAGAEAPSGENIQAAFTKFIDSKYAQFDQEKLRAANQELAAMIQQVALVTSISDEQKKQLFAAQEELKKKEQEAFYSRQECQRREAELNKNRQELEEAKAARRKAEEQNRPQAEVQALKTREQAAAKQVYVSTQNHANASKAAKESAMAGVAQTVTTYNNVASHVNQATKTAPRQAEGQHRPQARQAYTPPQNYGNAKGSAVDEVVQGINTYNEVASQLNHLSSELGVAASIPTVPRALPGLLSTFGSLFD